MVEDKLQNDVAQDITREQQDERGAHFQHQREAALFADVIGKEHPAEGEPGEERQHGFMDEVLRKEIIDKHPAGKQGDGKQDAAYPDGDVEYSQGKWFFELEDGGQSVGAPAGFL